MFQLSINKNFLFSSRNDEKEDIKKNFNKLFQYTLNGQINKIDTKYFLRDFAEIVQEVECPICLQFPLNPIQCSKCLKIFCKTCQITKNCANCRGEFKEKELDRILRNILDKLLLRCKNCEKYNGKLNLNKIKVSEYIKHLSNCEYSDYQCLFCKKIIQHSKQKCYEHAHFCGYADSSCCYCLKNIKIYLKKDHEIKCGEELIPCEFCQTQLERKKIENHKKNLCLFRIIKCNECKESYKFKDFETHLKQECKDNQIKYWKKKFEEAKQVLEEDFDFKYNEENLSSLRKKKTLERQNTEVNLLSNLNIDYQLNNSMSEREKKPLNPFLDSSIIREKDINYINDLFKDKIFVNFSLVYKMSKDGEYNFHKKCDKIGPTLSVFKIKKNKYIDSFIRYGGFTSIDWDKDSVIKKDEAAFIFSLTRRKVFKAKRPFYSIYCSSFCGPSFGATDYEPSLWTKGTNGGYNICETFGDSERECTCGNKTFIVDELEVYKVSF